MDSPARKVSVLVIDDDAANLRVFVRVFRKIYDVIVANSGVEALEILAARAAAGQPEVDVTFVDYQMPGMNGLDVLRELVRRHPAIVRYMLTGNCDAQQMAELQDSGLCVRVLDKPWDRGDIAQAVADAVAAGGVAP